VVMKFVLKVEFHSTMFALLFLRALRAKLVMLLQGRKIREPCLAMSAFVSIHYAVSLSSKNLS
jgi:hypothetical protein